MTSETPRSLPAYAAPATARRDVLVETELAPEPRVAAVARAATRSQLLRPSSLALYGFAAGLAVAVLWALQDSLIDDAFISLDYARTLAFHGDWGAVPGIPSNTATSPLNIVVLAAVTFVVRDPMTALWIVTITNAVLLAVGLIRLGTHWRVGARLAWVAVPLLLLNPLLASSTGMETMLAVTLFVFLLDTALTGDSRRYGWLTGVAMVTRPDLVIVAAVVWLMHPALRKPRPLPAALGTAWRAALVGLPWFVFSWFHFGSAVPDTLAIKRGQDWGDYATGLWDRYHGLYPAATNAVLAITTLGILVVVATPFLSRSRYRSVARSVASAGLAGAAYFVAYSQLGVPPYFWYYAVPVVGATLALAFAIAAASLAAVEGTTSSRLLCGAVSVAVLSPTVAIWANGLAQHAPLREAPIHGNWALTPEYKRIGLDLADEIPDGAVVRSAGEFGTILYYCDCTLIDRFDQRALVMPQLVDAREASWLGELNYLWLHPDDYALMHQDYHLRYREGERPARERPLDTWQVYSPTRGPGRYSLWPGSRPEDIDEGFAG
jgi:hypothetical protein